MFLAGSGVRTPRVLVVLHEDEVPVLEEALVVAAREVTRASPKSSAAIEVQLRARSARPGRAHLPEVLRARALDDPLARDAHLQPRLDGLLIRSEAELIVAGEHGDPDVLLAEAEALARQVPGEADRPSLK